MQGYQLAACGLMSEKLGSAARSDAREKPIHKGTAGQYNKRCREFQVKRKTPAERAHHDRVAQMGCLVCGARPVEVHHVVGYADKPGRLPKDHRRVVPLCFAHHSVQGGREAVHTLGHRGFYERHGIDLLAEAERLWND